MGTMRRLKRQKQRQELEMQQKGLMPKAKKDAIASKIKLKEKVEITSFKDFSMGYAVPPNQKKVKTNDGKKTSRVSNNMKKMTKANTKKTSLKSLSNKQNIGKKRTNKQMDYKGSKKNSSSSSSSNNNNISKKKKRQRNTQH